MKEYPRFSTLLRANFALDVKLPVLSTSGFSNAKEKGIELQKHTFSAIIADFPANKRNVFKTQIQHFRRIVEECMGFDEKPDLVEQTGIFLFWLLLDQHVLNKNTTAKIKETFGSTFQNSQSKLHKIVQQIQSLLEVDEWKDLRNKTTKACAAKYEDECIFASNIKIRLMRAKPETFEKLQDLAPSAITKNPSAINFSMQYQQQDSKEIPSKKAKDLSSEVKELIDIFEATGIEQHLILLTNLLKSSRPNADIENELVELIGFERLELVQTVLNCRKVIAAEIENYKKVQSHVQKKMHNEQRPTVSRAVVVQSAEEKELKKQNRRDEKKVQRIINSTSRHEDPTENTAEGLDSIRLRMQMHQGMLRNAQQQPVLKTTQRLRDTWQSASQDTPKFPYVFDSQMAAKQHAGFIGANRISLPETANRIDNPKYEEVQIAASDPPPLSVGNNRIKIEDLDELGKSAFENCSHLNRIQSVVFPVAYNSNENMLVCAPTGAGKTNVAMLTIVHTIRAHVEDGVICRDNFKIVYIAPMKALAAEMVDNFSKRLKSLNIVVRELTGDMKLSKQEIAQTQILVTTPEKWDVVTRKGSGDVELISLVKLLIIDEVHLLHGDRGPVVEALVARTLRLVESSQNMIRIVGLSATLPNYIDVAYFLRVNPMKGLFYFDSRFRPVPLDTNFIGIKSLKTLQQTVDMDLVCYKKCLEMVQQDHQVMVFVHARNATVRTASTLRENAQQNNTGGAFIPKDSNNYSMALRAVQKSRNKQLVELFSCGFGIHHAGMLRSDRRMVEQYFAEGHIKVLVCTATLAWGVNLPAHAVIIKGTDIYDSQHGSFVDLGILDVLQIFGRAGRPQYDKRGVGTIITTHDKLNHYLSLLTNQFPIESNFVQYMADNLNAEIALGTITNVDEAVEWLSYTYLYVRMRKNPHCYGIDYDEVRNDPYLDAKRQQLILAAAKALDKARMIRFNERTLEFNITDLGRTASHFYIKYDTVETFNELMQPMMNEGEIFAMISQAQEFQQLKVRDDELDELDDLKRDHCHIKVFGGSENVCGKVNILMQTYLSHGYVRSFSLISDMSYIVQNIVRISRALFSIVLRNNNAFLAGHMLNVCKMFERQQWEFQSPLRQFPILTAETIEKIENRGMSILTLAEYTIPELNNMLRNQRYAEQVHRAIEEIPMIDVETTLQPITRTVLRIKLDVTATFNWNDRVHGKVGENFWIWIDDPDTNFIYHAESFMATRKFVCSGKSQQLVMTVQLKEPLPSQYFVRIASDTWLGCQNRVPLNLTHLVLPEHHPPLTALLALQPLSVKCLRNELYESLYRFTHFNPIQTQIFHCLYHTDNNVLLGAPTGSGKTIVAEIAMLRSFNKNPKDKIVYIAPLKALVKERMKDWKERFEQNMNKKVVELTGDTSPDIMAIRAANIIVTTPEKWDGISRSWQTREYVKDVRLIVIDEIHLLGEDRGPVIEVIVSRTNYITSHTGRSIRIVGLSTALANAQDLANWLDIKKMGLYNFKPSVRPVPLEVHISGYSGKHYCPRMATMNRPTYQAIKTYAPSDPVIVFVSSRRQTRLTALDLITFVGGSDNQKQFLHISENEIQQILQGIKDSNLKLCLAFGIGLHHAGLQETDRRTVEELFYHRKIQILVATATLAWGVNLPAHLVVIKGTEYFDGKVKKYVDMPITDVLQMMGRAGRPQFDTRGVAVVLVHDVKKNFYKKFLYDPFPVESSLLGVLEEHINAEIVSSTVQTKQAALDYLTWTYFFRRLMRNPTYYNLEALEPEDLNSFMSSLVERVVNKLEASACIIQKEEMLVPTFMGRIASFYYLSHRTMKHFLEDLKPDMSTCELVLAIADSYEFDQQPVRHNEDKYNEELAKMCRFRPPVATWDSPYTKTFLLLQAHFMRLTLPNTDYLTDTKSTLDNATRVMQAMVDYTAECGWLSVTLKIQQLMQSIIQARWFDESELLTLPHVTAMNIDLFSKIPSNHEHPSLPVLKEICSKNYNSFAAPLRTLLEEPAIEQIYKVLMESPEIGVHLSLRGPTKFEAQSQRTIRTWHSPDYWMPILPNEEYVIAVELNQMNSKRMFNTSIHCPKYPKGKTEAYFITLGSQENNELLAMKRVSMYRGPQTYRICFHSTPKLGRLILTLYLMSDCLIGFDQQFDIQFDVVEPAYETDQIHDKAYM